jgi:tRNA(Arg) A34 adenosine deaminase TadA
MSQKPQIRTSMQFSLPYWVADILQTFPAHLPDIEAQMDLAILLSAFNVQYQTGGPFGAIVVDEDTGLIISAGVNLVVPNNCSGLHGEAVALFLAQQKIDNFDLGASGMPRHRLVTSAQPCVQCFGMVHWSGIFSLVIGANTEDVQETTGFDEGPIHPQWRNELTYMGISLREGVQRAKARAVLQQYKNFGGLIYQGRGCAVTSTK